MAKRKRATTPAPVMAAPADAFVASCFDPVLKKTTTSPMPTLEEAQIRAKSLRIDVPLVHRGEAQLKVHCPDGTTWSLRKSPLKLGPVREFWREDTK